jgi:glutaredoxin
MDIVLFTFDGCPHGEPARRLLEHTLAEFGLRVPVRTVFINDVEQAEQYRFLGSPTIQIDGQDIEVRRRSDEASFSCRVYNTPGGTSGIPPKDILVHAIKEARH